MEIIKSINGFSEMIQEVKAEAYTLLLGTNTHKVHDDAGCEDHSIRTNENRHLATYIMNHRNLLSNILKSGSKKYQIISARKD